MELYADYRVAGFVTFSMGVVNHMRTASLYGEKRSGTSPPWEFLSNRVFVGMLL